jgi:lipocalin
MIQNLIVQPSSPLCNPKPVPVQEFQLDAFMGQWYQVNGIKVFYAVDLTNSQ